MYKPGLIYYTDDLLPHFLENVYDYQKTIYSLKFTLTKYEVLSYPSSPNTAFKILTDDHK